MAQLPNLIGRNSLCHVPSHTKYTKDITLNHTLLPTSNNTQTHFKKLAESNKKTGLFCLKTSKPSVSAPVIISQKLRTSHWLADFVRLSFCNTSLSLSPPTPFKACTNVSMQDLEKTKSVTQECQQ